MSNIINMACRLTRNSVADDNGQSPHNYISTVSSVLESADSNLESVDCSVNSVKIGAWARVFTLTDTRLSAAHYHTSCLILSLIPDPGCPTFYSWFCLARFG